MLGHFNESEEVLLGEEARKRNDKALFAKYKPNQNKELYAKRFSSRGSMKYLVENIWFSGKTHCCEHFFPLTIANHLHRTGLAK